MTVVQMMNSDPRNKEGVFHFSISFEPRGSPGDKGWQGTMFKADGLTREETARVLLSVAAKINNGESLQEIVCP